MDLDRALDYSYNSYMKIASISHAKNNLSAYLDMVRNGETIIIMDRNRPLARLEPAVQDDGMDSDGRLSRLERSGLLRRASRRAPDKTILQVPAPSALNGASIVEALLHDRDEGR